VGKVCTRLAGMEDAVIHQIAGIQHELNVRQADGAAGRPRDSAQTSRQEGEVEPVSRCDGCWEVRCEQAPARVGSRDPERIMRTSHVRRCSMRLEWIAASGGGTPKNPQSPTAS